MDRGHLIGKVLDIKAHLECRGLLLNGGVIHAISELGGHADGVEIPSRRLPVKSLRKRFPI